MISSSKNVVKSKDKDSVMIQPFVPPVQNAEQGLEEKKKTGSKTIKKFEPERISQEELSAGGLSGKEKKQKRAEPADSELEMQGFEDSFEDADGFDLPEEEPDEEALLHIEAEEILRQAREKAVLEKQKASEDGYREGFEWGRQEGFRQAKKEHEMRLAMEMEAFQQQMKEALASVETAKNRCLDQYLDALKDCAVAVGEKVIHISLQSSGAVIRRMILSEVEKLKKSVWIKIYIGRSDYDLMMEADEDMINELSRFSDHVKFVVMNKEKRGDCIIEVPDEVIDISVDTQMENIRRVLENVR